MISPQENNLLSKLIDPRELISLNGWMKVEGKDLKGDAIVVLTDFSISIFQYNSESKLIQKFKEWIVSTKAIKSDKKQHYSFEFYNSSFKLITPLFDLIQIYQMHLYNLLQPDEIPELPEEFLLPKNELPISPNLTKRFVAFSMLQNHYPPLELVRNLETFMKTTPDHFALSDVPGLDSFFETFLIGLSAFNKINHLTINGNPDSPYQSMAKHSSSLKNIKWITLTIPPDQYFYEFLSSLSGFKLNRLDFEDISLSINALDSLNTFSVNKQITFLSFNHVSFDMKESKVLDVFSNLVKSNHVETLGFTTFRFDKRRQLLDTIFGLKSLYLQGTGVDLSLLFKMLAKSNASFVDFSGSKCRKLIDPSLRFNPNLCKIILNHISYTAESLQTIFNIIANHTQPLSVSLSFAQLTNQHWKEFFDKNIPLRNIQVLNWIQNPLSHQFIKLLTKSSQLKYLGVGGRPKAEGIIEIIEKTSSIEYLDISGTEKKMKGNVMKVMTALKKSKRSIRHIDVSKNDIGNKNFQNFYELAMDCVDDFICDSNGFIDNDVYEKLFDECKKKHHRIKATCPYFDYSNIQSKRQRKRIIEDFEQYWGFKVSDKTLQEIEWKYHVSGYTESPIPPEDACEVTMIPAPSSDYEPLIDERKIQGQTEEQIHNQWSLDTLDVPQATSEALTAELMKKFSFQSLTQTLYKIASREQQQNQ